MRRRRKGTKRKGKRGRRREGRKRRGELFVCGGGTGKRSDVIPEELGFEEGIVGEERVIIHRNELKENFCGGGGG